MIISVQNADKNHANAYSKPLIEKENSSIIEIQQSLKLNWFMRFKMDEVDVWLRKP